MVERPKLTRRSILAGLPLISGLAACSMDWESREPWVFEPNNRADLLRSFVKIAGSLTERQLYLQYYGEIISVVPGQVDVPLFRLKGLVRQRWSPQRNMSYVHSNYDHGLFCDWQNGAVLERFENPLTGAVNDPLHYKSDPLVSTIGLGEGQDDPSGKEWRTSGNQVCVTQTRIGREFDNPIKPSEYPRASTGEKVQYSGTSSYFADARDIGNPKLDAVEADHTWMFVINYPAWMQMGDAPGLALWRWAGKKFMDEAEIDPDILAAVQERVPGFMTDDQPWPERSDGWTQYSRERSPEPREGRSP